MKYLNHQDVDCKQLCIHPDPTTWNWTRPDAWTQHIIDNDQILRMHCPIGPQSSDWAKDDNRTTEELEANLREFFISVCERYNDKPGFKYMDVVNETVIKGAWHTEYYPSLFDTDYSAKPAYYYIQEALENSN